MSSLDWASEEFCHVGDSTEAMKGKIPRDSKVKLFLTDPPYNIGHNYGNVSDRLKKDEYQLMIKEVLKSAYEVADDSSHFFMIHYPEKIAEMWPIIIQETGWKFKQWITWVYPSNIGMSPKGWTRASRTVLWLVKDEGGDPTFHPKRIIRPYRNPWDKRVAQLIKDGKRGCALYDWWEINLTKNVNKEKSDYSNQIPETLLRRIIRSTTDVGDLVADPFAGTFSTVKAAIATGRLGWGCDLNEDTQQYWPNDNDFNTSYQEEEFSVDQQEQFDVVRAGISQSNLNNLIRRACENDELPPRMKKWTINELNFIDNTIQADDG